MEKFGFNNIINGLSINIIMLAFLIFLNLVVFNKVEIVEIAIFIMLILSNSFLLAVAKNEKKKSNVQIK